MVNHLSQIDCNETKEPTPPIKELFPDEQLFALLTSDIPWFADIVNCLACNIVPYDFTYQQKKKFFYDVKSYF